MLALGKQRWTDDYHGQPQCILLSMWIHWQISDLKERAQLRLCVSGKLTFFLKFQYQNSVSTTLEVAFKCSLLKVIFGKKLIFVFVINYYYYYYLHFLISVTVLKAEMIWSIPASSKCCSFELPIYHSCFKYQISIWEWLLWHFYRHRIEIQLYQHRIELHFIMYIW